MPDPTPDEWKIDHMGVSGEECPILAGITMVKTIVKDIHDYAVQPPPHPKALKCECVCPDEEDAKAVEGAALTELVSNAPEVLRDVFAWTTIRKGKSVTLLATYKDD